jgi:hypothetical protein
MYSDSGNLNDYQNKTNLQKSFDYNNELLLKNKEMINNLIFENNNRKDKSYLTIKELENMKDFESNLIKVLENFPPYLVKKLIEETSDENMK